MRRPGMSLARTAVVPRASWKSRHTPVPEEEEEGNGPAYVLRRVRPWSRPGVNLPTGTPPVH
eukprot:7155813-Pyramimonas_sp.AAC.1